MSHAKCAAEVVALSDDEAARMFDEVTCDALGLSADEFLRRWDRGDYAGIDLDAIPGLVVVWMYLPFVR